MFIVVCEAFLHVTPHFGLWLKVFNVKPKVVEGQHAECGGAMVSKLNKVTWPKGRFVDTVKVWQQEWFYITEPRDVAWVAALEFIFGPPVRLTSWTKKGLDRGSSTEVEALQKCVSNMIKAGAKLTNMVQVMLCPRLLPCQQRATPVWSYKLKDPATVQYFYGTTHEKLWKVLFKPQKDWSTKEEYIGLDAANPPREV